MTVARWVVIVCGLTAVGEVGLWAATIDRVASIMPAGLVLVVFLIGPPVFLGLLAWRRRAHPVWPRRFLALATGLALVGLGILGWDCYRYHTDPEFRKVRSMNGVLVPLGQWVAVLAIWLVVVIREGREKRAATK
jgi:hypothetical protein